MKKNNKIDVHLYELNSDSRSIFTRVNRFTTTDISVLLLCLTVLYFTAIGDFTVVNCIGLCTILLCGLRPLFNEY